MGVLIGRRTACFLGWCCRAQLLRMRWTARFCVDFLGVALDGAGKHMVFRGGEALMVGLGGKCVVWLCGT